MKNLKNGNVKLNGIKLEIKMTENKEEIYVGIDIGNTYTKVCVRNEETGEYEIIEGMVNDLYKQGDNVLNFSVDGVEFSTISNGYNNRGFHTEDYDDSFVTDDVIRVYYINKLENSYHNYSEKVIVKIEKFTQ